MAESDPIDDAVLELVRQLPIKEIYQDGLSEPVKETGKLVTDLIKTFRLVLAPIQFTAAWQDRLSRFIDHSVRQIPEDKRIAPPPQILGPVLEGIRYEPEGTPIDEMFSELLSRSMDMTRVDEAHPAYPQLIRQLSSDEAILLRYLQGERISWERKAKVEGDGKAAFSYVPVADSLGAPHNLNFYAQHLEILGLALFHRSLMNSEDAHGPGEFKLWLTNFGEHFVRACLRVSPSSDPS